MAVELARLTNSLDEGSAKNVNASFDDGDKSKIDFPSSQTIDKDPLAENGNQVEVKQGFLRRCRAKCCKRDPNPKKPVGFESNPNLRVKNTIKRIVNGRFVLTLMTFVTIFALIGVSH